MKLILALTLLSSISHASAIRSVNSSTSIADVADLLLICDATAGDVTITLPGCPMPVSGYAATHKLKKTDNSANSCKLVRAGTDLIDGATSLTVTTQYEAREVQCDGISNWISL